MKLRWIAKSRAACFGILLLSLLANTALAASTYRVHNLVSNGGVPADHIDTNLQNAWGIVLTATSPMWVSDNGSGHATVYDGNGNAFSILVTIPAAPDEDAGSPTGIAANGSSDFVVRSATAAAPARFLFATEGGVIAGWAPTVDASHAIHGAFSGAAVYKGLALASNAGRNMLYAADFRGRKIDMYNASFTPVKAPGAFVDATVPADFGPFNILFLGGRLYVAYAQKDPNSNDELHGPGLGIVDAYDTAGNLLQRIATGGTLNAPWGMAIAPAGFGDFSGALLVGNFGDGTINAFNPTTGVFMGQLHGTDGNPIVIDGLWGISFGNNAQNQPATTLFFAAGPHDEADGLYGRIDLVAP